MQRQDRAGVNCGVDHQRDHAQPGRRAARGVGRCVPWYAVGL